MHALLRGIFPTQGSNPGLPHCKKTLYHLSRQGSPTCPTESTSKWVHTSRSGAAPGHVWLLAAMGGQHVPVTLPPERQGLLEACAQFPPDPTAPRAFSLS